MSQVDCVGKGSEAASVAEKLLQVRSILAGLRNQLFSKSASRSPSHVRCGDVCWSIKRAYIVKYVKGGPRNIRVDSLGLTLLFRTRVEVRELLSHELYKVSHA